jgi:DNA-binding MarR family transcriptional regulator
MDRYMLSDEGRARFRRIKTSGDRDANFKIRDYEILDYLYRHEFATVEEIAESTGLSPGQVGEKLMNFLNRGYIKGYFEKLTG